MKSKQKCIICGAPVSAGAVFRQRQRGVEILCVSCDQKRKQDSKNAYINNKKRLFGDRVCVICGKQLQWNDSFALRNPKYFPTACSKECRGKLSKRSREVTKEQIITRLSKEIAKAGTYVQRAELLKRCKISATTLCKYNISTSELNKQVLGLSTCPLPTVEQPVDIQVLSLTEIIDAYKLQQCTCYGNIVKAFSQGTRRRYERVFKAFLVDVALSYIQHCGQYIGIVKLSEDLHVGHRLFSSYGIDTDSLNKLLGYCSYTSTSFFEELTYKILMNHFDCTKISRQHSFGDCKSVYGYPLRFDFFLSSIKVAIEIDGQMHDAETAKRMQRATVENDKIKNSYASNNGIQLIRIPTTPKHTFADRVIEQVLGIVKPVELLETPPSKVEGNQQPSPDIREGSETIEKQQ